MENNFITAEDLRVMLEKLSKSGYGDMKIKFQDSYLYKDEIEFNYITREILFHGMLYNFPLTERIIKFNDDIQKAYRKYMGS